MNESELVQFSTLQLVEHHFVDIAPTPLFTGLERLDDRMIRRAKMFGRVFVFRRIATADVPADHAESQVYPCVANLQAVFTAIGAGCYFADLIEMCASHDFGLSIRLCLQQCAG